MAYDLEEWTPSTLKTLKFLKERNALGKITRLGDLPSGTFRNWAYVLQRGSYVESSGGGFQLTKSGDTLLTELLNNPPKDQRGKRREKRELKSQAVVVRDENIFDLVLQGRNMRVHVLLSQEDAARILVVISELRGKSK